MRYALLLLTLLASSASTALAAPTVVDSTTEVRTTGTTFDVVVPSHTSGDLMIGLGLSGHTTARNVSAPAGFNLVGSAEYNSTANLFAWYKIATGSEGSVYTFTTTDSSTAARAIIISISGAADPGVIPIVFNAAERTGSSGTVASQDVTATNDDSLLLRLMADIYDGTPTGWTAPSGHSLVITASAATPSMLVASKTVNTGSTGTADFTYDITWHSSFGGMVLAIAPAASGGSIVPILVNQTFNH